jgi:hypothetical protein
MSKNILITITAALCALPVMAQALPPPTPVPEPSTIFAGAVLLAPLAIGAARALWKNRK